MTNAPASIEEYIASRPPEVRGILEKIAETIRKAAPGAEETISYQIPTFRLDGTLAHFAAFKHHIGFYPPVRGDESLVRAVARFANAKGNLRFPLDEPIPYALIGRIVRARVRENKAKAAAAKLSGRRRR